MDNNPQLNDPHAILEYVRPFFPDDPSLAIRAIQKAFPELPIWISKFLMVEMFGALSMLHSQTQYEISLKTYGDNIVGHTRKYTSPQDIIAPICLN